MKLNKFSIFILFCFFSFWGKAQEVKDILEQIRQNNPKIKAAIQLQQKRELDLKVAVLPESPTIEYGYYKNQGGENVKKSTYGISQQFRFPTAYAREAGLNSHLRSMSQLELKAEVQNELYKANRLLIDLAYQLDLEKILKERQSFMARLKSDFHKRHKEGAANILELNKVNWQVLAVETKLSELQVQIQNTRKEIRSLNANQALNLGYPVFETTDFAVWENFFLEYKEQSPYYLMLQESKTVNQKSLALSKANLMPNINLGYEMEKTTGQDMSGVRAGISIPIWGTGKKLKSGKLQFQAQENLIQNQEWAIKTSMEQKYAACAKAQENWKLYNNQQTSENSTDLLKKAFQAGHLSFVEFFTELDYYFEIDEKILSLKKDYQQAYADLYSFKL